MESNDKTIEHEDFRQYLERKRRVLLDELAFINDTLGYPPLMTAKQRRKPAK